MSINKENISEVTDIVQSDLQDLIDKYASKNMPVVDVVHAYIEHCVHFNQADTDEVDPSWPISGLEGCSLVRFFSDVAKKY